MSAVLGFWHGFELFFQLVQLATCSLGQGIDLHHIPVQAVKSFAISGRAKNTPIPNFHMGQKGDGDRITVLINIGRQFHGNGRSGTLGLSPVCQSHP